MVQYQEYSKIDGQCRFRQIFSMNLTNLTINPINPFLGVHNFDPYEFDFYCWSWINPGDRIPCCGDSSGIQWEKSHLWHEIQAVLLIGSFNPFESIYPSLDKWNHMGMGQSWRPRGPYSKVFSSIDSIHHSVVGLPCSPRNFNLQRCWTGSQLLTPWGICWNICCLGASYRHACWDELCCGRSQGSIPNERIKKVIKDHRIIPKNEPSGRNESQFWRISYWSSDVYEAKYDDQAAATSAGYHTLAMTPVQFRGHHGLTISCKGPASWDSSIVGLSLTSP